jgi:hypothetical protein
MTLVDHVIAFVRSLEKDHDPYGWPAIQMRDFSALAGEIERLRSDALKGQKDYCELMERYDALSQASNDYLVKLRDQFAMAALQGSIAADTAGNMAMEEHVRYAWQTADAMMKERRNTHD